MAYLSPDTADLIKQLHADGAKYKEIAYKAGVCEATVSNVVCGKRKSTGRKKRNLQQASSKSVEPEEVIYGSLPGDVLFVHVREHNFIG